MYTPTKKKVMFDATKVVYGGHGRNGESDAAVFQSHNPFDTLNASIAARSGHSNDSSQSSTSPVASVSSSETVTGDSGYQVTTNVSSLFKEQAHLQSSTQGQGISRFSSRTLSNNQDVLSSFSPPTRNRTQGSAIRAAHGVQRCESLSSQSPETNNSPRGRITSVYSATSTRPLSILHPSFVGDAQSILGINEALAVQEFAFRRGQQDRGNTRDRIPKSNFHPKYDILFEKFYQNGKHSECEPILIPSYSHSPARENYAWPILINPYTQTQEHPKGALDAAWSRDIVKRSLDGMEALIIMVLKRPKEWCKIVVDIPMQIQNALVDFPDLANKYERLKRDAREALGGGIPTGYCY